MCNPGYSGIHSVGHQVGLEFTEICPPYLPNERVCATMAWCRLVTAAWHKLMFLTALPCSGPEQLEPVATDSSRVDGRWMLHTQGKAWRISDRPRLRQLVDNAARAQGAASLNRRVPVHTSLLSFLCFVHSLLTSHSGVLLAGRRARHTLFNLSVIGPVLQRPGKGLYDPVSSLCAFGGWRLSESKCPCGSSFKMVSL